MININNERKLKNDAANVISNCALLKFAVLFCDHLLPLQYRRNFQVLVLAINFCQFSEALNVSFCYPFPRKLVQIDEMSNMEEADLKQKEPAIVRVTHPPDQIIHGKPKWTDVSICKDDEDTGFSIDRLNPSRHMIEVRDENWYFWKPSDYS